MRGAGRLRPGPDGTLRVGLTDAERDANREEIRRQIGEIAAWYRFTPKP